MNKSDLVTAMASKSGMTKKDTELALTTFMDVVTETLASGEKIQLVGFGSFDVGQRSERIGRNPLDGSEVHIAATKYPKFKAGSNLKNAVKGA